jgi:hypothetical protein
MLTHVPTMPKTEKWQKEVLNFKPWSFYFLKLHMDKTIVFTFSYWKSLKIVKDFLHPIL